MAIALGIIILIHIFVISNMTFFPYPELFIYPYLKNLGMAAYQQILDQHFPGVMLLPVNLGSLGIDTTEEMFFLHISVIVSTHFLLYWICAKVLKIKNRFLPNLFYLLWHPYLEGNVLWIDSFMPLFFLPGFAFLYKAIYEKGKSTRYLNYSAFLIGLSILFKQVVIPVVFIICLFLYWKSQKRKVFRFAAIALIPIAFVCIYYISTGIFKDFFYWTFTYNVTVFAQLGRKFPSLIDIAKTAFIFLPALFLLVFTPQKKYKNLLFLFLAGSFIFAYARFDPVHLQPALVFASLALAVFFDSIPKKMAANLLILYILISTYFISSHYKRLLGDGVKFFGPEINAITQKIESYTNKNDVVFILGSPPHLYFLTKTKPPNEVFVFQFPWFMEVAEQRVLEALIKDPPKLVVRDSEASIQGIKLVEYMPKINHFVDKKYTVEETVNGTEIMLPYE